MALTFVSGGSNRVDFGSAAALDDLTAYTAILCVYPTDTTSGRRFFNKGADNNGTAVWWDWSTAGDIACVCNRATTDATAIATSPLTQNAWQELAVTYSNALGFNVYTRPLTGLFTETSYTGTPVAGSGARLDDSAQSLIWGNRDEIDAAFGGAISCAKFFSAKLTLAELNQHAYGDPHLASNLVYAELGWNGTGTQIDYSGNGNDGAVTGATVSDHAPTINPFRNKQMLPYVVAAASGVTIPVFMNHYRNQGAA